MVPMLGWVAEGFPRPSWENVKKGEENKVSRTLDIWTGEIVIPETGANTHEILFRARLDHDPRRIVLLRVPRRSEESFRRYFDRAAKDLETRSPRRGRRRIALNQGDQ